jgi:hypothetical protein
MTSNLKSVSNHSSSIFANNRLTKSYFSLSDSITHKANLRDALLPIKTAVKSLMNNRKSVLKSFRERYKSTEITSVNDEFFHTKAETVDRLR